MQLINVGALAGAEAEMVQADAILLEGRPRVLRRRRADRERGTAADAIIDLVGVDDGLHAEKRQQLAIERAGAFEIRCGQKNMRDAVDFHRLPLGRETISDNEPVCGIASIPQADRTVSRA